MAPTGELGAQANARFNGGWPEAVRSHEALLVRGAQALDLAWSYARAQERLTAMEAERRAQLAWTQQEAAAVSVARAALAATEDAPLDVIITVAVQHGAPVSVEVKV